MTDGTKQITHEAALEAAERYFEAIGADVRTLDNTWEVIVPESADTPLEEGVLEVRVDSDPPSEYDGPRIGSDSSLFERIVTAASDLAPAGTAALTSEHTDVIRPSWLRESDLAVDEMAFRPYYDRTAVCCLIRVSVETVSEFETDYLRAIAVDLRSQERLSRLAEMYLERYNDQAIWEADTTAMDPSESTLEEAIDTAQEQAVDEVADEIAEIANEASRSAAVEFDEYREYQQQRLDEVTTEIDRLRERLDDISARMDAISNQEERIELLEKRRELRGELNDLTNKRATLQEKLDRGFVDARDEIYDRHAVEVNVSPVTGTLAVYERGELDLRVTGDGQSHSLALQYATGEGVTQRLECGVCGTPLSVENPAIAAPTSLRGEACCTSSED